MLGGSWESVVEEVEGRRVAVFGLGGGLVVLEEEIEKPEDEVAEGVVYRGRGVEW